MYAPVDSRWLIEQNSRVAEDRRQEGQQMRKRLESLVSRWAQGKVTLQEILGRTDAESYSVASQGYLLFLQGKTETARILFEGCVACDPKNAYYYRALGCIYLRSGESAKALKQFTYAIRVAPREVSAYINRAEIYVSAQQWDKARTDLNQAMRLAGRNEGALVKKARAIMAMLP